MINKDNYIAGLRLMERIGGGFASAIATAALRADNTNWMKLYLAFSDMFNEFKELATKERKD